MGFLNIENICLSIHICIFSVIRLHSGYKKKKKECLFIVCSVACQNLLAKTKQYHRILLRVSTDVSFSHHATSLTTLEWHNRYKVADMIGWSNSHKRNTQDQLRAQHLMLTTNLLCLIGSLSYLTSVWIETQGVCRSLLVTGWHWWKEQIPTDCPRFFP